MPLNTAFHKVLGVTLCLHTHVHTTHVCTDSDICLNKNPASCQGRHDSSTLAQQRVAGDMKAHAAAQDCNLVVYNGTYLTQGPSSQWAAYQTQTAGKGTPLCRAFVSSAAGGYWTILDANGATVFTSFGTAQPVVDTLPSGGTLAQGVDLFSANGLYYLVAQVGRPMRPHTSPMILMRFLGSSQALFRVHVAHLSRPLRLSLLQAASR